ncbi:Sperm-associated antigen 16 protein [Coelomomyces lativittatus]|nr:Sperm-associated antigen 16 protein [Coelomomyces lativittatus]
MHEPIKLTKDSKRKTKKKHINEWYERQQKNAEELSEAAFVPEVYHQNSILETKLTQLRLEARAFKQLAENTQSQFNQLRKEKEYLKLQYQRSLQDKSKLQTRCQEQKREIDQFKSTQIELQAKLDHMLKLNTLLKLGRDKESPKKDGEKEKENLNKVKIDIEHAEPATKEKFEPQGLTKHKEKQNIPTSLPTVNEPTRKSVTLSPSHKVTLKKKMGLSHSLPNEDRYNPHIDTTYTPLCITRIQALHEILCIKAHSLSVSNLTFHPRKMVLASASDDKSWKLWNFPSGELLMCGEGHKSWISGIDFHPNGHYLATPSGDLTIKLWDFSQPQALLTMADHLRPVWACLIHDAGNHLLSCSLDATAKLWDLTTYEKNKQTPTTSTTTRSIHILIMMLIPSSFSFSKLIEFRNALDFV